MVLTNFELWAADGSSAINMPLEYETTALTRHLNPFDRHAVPPQINSNITHLSSNGYYGFSYINAAHNDIEDSNNNSNINSNNNNNNNTSTYNFNANDVNGMNTTMTAKMTIPPQTHAISANNIDSSVNVAGHAANVTRCKKRFFVMNDADDCTASNKNHNGCDISAKRCRFDDDCAAQYCNDFFSLPSTQIATQSCLMDTEEVIHAQPQQQQQYFPIQQQVDEAMFEYNNNIEKYEQNLHLQLQHQQQEQSQMQKTTSQSTPSTPHQQLAQSPQQQNMYHQQQHYQDMITTCNNHRTCKIDTQNSENLIKFHNPEKTNEHVANDCKVDVATLFAQLHGGCWHHFVNNTITSNNNDVVKQ